VLIGRDPEQRLIDSLIEGARGGASAALVIRGDAGIGKTALLEQALETSRTHALRCIGVQSEHDLPFAGLEQLFRPVRDLADRLPDPQAATLRSAFGLSSDRVEDRLLLGVATLGLLAEAGGDQPLLCVIDDLQWLDPPSAQALLFAARRLGAEGVVMLFAVRDDPADWFETPGMQEGDAPAALGLCRARGRGDSTRRPTQPRRPAAVAARGGREPARAAGAAGPGALGGRRDRDRGGLPCSSNAVAARDAPAAATRSGR
jgi:hypothetical protein